MASPSGNEVRPWDGKTRVPLRPSPVDCPEDRTPPSSPSYAPKPPPGPVERAEEALRLSAATVEEKLVADVLGSVGGCATLRDLASLAKGVVALDKKYPGLVNAWPMVGQDVWKKAEELAPAELPKPLADIVAEMGFFKLVGDGGFVPESGIVSYLDSRRPQRNAELGDRLMKKLADVAHVNPRLALAVARFLNKGRRTTPRGDPLTEAVKKRCNEAETEPTAKRKRRESEGV